MSTAAGVAAVTAVLKDLLIDGLIDNDITGAVGDVSVSAQPPDRVTPVDGKSQLNLFLYLLTPNQGWRNFGLPARDANGTLVSAPPLGLDLHYLLTAYGLRDLHAEILLGHAMKLLHEMPVLTRPAIRQALGNSLAVESTGGDIPAELSDLAMSGLADQVEQIKISQTFLSTEEMFKLWMAFQAPYRPTVAYHVSVVLIESERQAAGAPPVRGRTITAAPIRHPRITGVLSRPAGGAAGDPFVAGRAILPGDRLRFVGRQLGGDGSKVVLDDELLADDAVEIGRTAVEFTLAADLLAGAHAVQVVHQAQIGLLPHPVPGPEAQVIETLRTRPEDAPYLPLVRTVAESNPAAFLLTPSIDSVVMALEASEPADGTFAGTMTVTVAPAIGQTQRVSLLLTEFDPPDPATRPARSYGFDAPSREDPNGPSTSPTIEFQVLDLQPGTYLARIRVDGATSPLLVDADGVYSEPVVVIP